MLLVASNVPAFFAQFELVSLAGWLFVVLFFFFILHMMFNLMPNCLRSKQYTLRIDASMLSFTWGNFKNYYLYVLLVRSKNREKKREFVSYIQYASCRFSYMCDVCYRTLASGPLAIAKLKKQTLRISRVHSSIFGKFNTHSQEPPYLCIVACTRIRFCRRP